jgi:hypothetical protein
MALKSTVQLEGLNPSHLALNRAMGSEETPAVASAAQGVLNSMGSRFSSLITSLQHTFGLASRYSAKEVLDTPCLPNEMLGHVFHFLNAEELARIAPVCSQWNALAASDAVSLSYGIPFPSWLKDIDAEVWEKYVDLKKYGLDLSEVPHVNRRILTKALKPLSRKVEKKMGITNIVIPKGLTLNIVLQIAKDNSVPIGLMFPLILTTFGDVAVGRTRVLFFTNSIFESTRKHTSDQHALDVKTIGQECGIAIQMHEIRDFMAFLVLTYISSSETSPIRHYSSNTFTRLIEKVNRYYSLTGGFTHSGLYAFADNYGYGNMGVGASGSSEDITANNK